MPIRPRRRRSARNQLTLRRYIDLQIGDSGVEPLAVLEAVFLEHRRRFDDESWAAAAFERGERIDLDDLGPDEGNVGLPPGL
jgi:hypothetical protein